MGTWYSIERQSAFQDALDAELHKEMVPGHVLEGCEAHAIGRRCDNDDVLYVLGDGDHAYAVVHPMWRRIREEDAACPGASVLLNAADMMARLIEIDAADFAGMER